MGKSVTVAVTAVALVVTLTLTGASTGLGEEKAAASAKESLTTIDQTIATTDPEKALVLAVERARLVKDTEIMTEVPLVDGTTLTLSVSTGTAAENGLEKTLAGMLTDLAADAENPRPIGDATTLTSQKSIPNDLTASDVRWAKSLGEGVERAKTQLRDGQLEFLKLRSTAHTPEEAIALSHLASRSTSRASIESPVSATSEVQSSAAGSCSDPWYPTSAYMAADQPNTTASRRGVTAIRYASISRLNNLADCPFVTLEPDFLLDNTDGRAYMSGDIGAWSSQLPNPYKDTNAFDGTDEPTWTIGTFTARSLQFDQRYQSTFYVPRGNTNFDNGKLNLQKGERVPGFCNSANCVFPRGTFIYLPFRSVPIPGFHSDTR